MGWGKMNGRVWNGWKGIARSGDFDFYQAGARGSCLVPIIELPKSVCVSACPLVKMHTCVGRY